MHLPIRDEHVLRPGGLGRPAKFAIVDGNLGEGTVRRSGNIGASSDHSHSKPHGARLDGNRSLPTILDPADVTGGMHVGEEQSPHVEEIGRIDEPEGDEQGHVKGVPAADRDRRKHGSYDIDENRSPELVVCRPEG